MGFMDKAKKFAEQAQQQAKDGTLKERAKALADQAQTKLDEVQGQFNDGQKTSAGAPGDAPAPEYDQHGRPVATPVPDEAVEAVQEAAQAPSPPPQAPAGDAPGVDRSHEAAPKLTGGDPLAG